MVRADKRKGQVIVKRSNDDQLIHFMWKDRAAGSVENDWILFPDDATWRRVKECTTGRVYILEFKTGAKHFFWMQEVSTSKDDEYSDQINDAINGRAPAGASAGLSGLLGQMGGQTGAAYDELAQASASFGRGSSSTGSNTTSTTTSASNSLSQRLQDAMNRIPAGGAPAAPPVLLNDVVATQDVLATGVLEDQALLAELQKHLPENERNSVINTLRSPQFRQSVDHLNAVLRQSPEALSVLLASFGVASPSNPASNRLETFLRAIQEHADKQMSEDAKKEEPK